MRMGSGRVAGAGGARLRFAAVGVLIALVLVLSWPAAARATTLEKMTIEQMSQRATTIVEGTVLSTEVEQSSFGVRTAVRISVTDSLKGSGSAVQTVYVPGGTLADGTQVVVDGMASFTSGQSCYVFVDRRGWVMGGFQGKLGVENGRVVGTGDSVGTMDRRVRAALGAAAPVVEVPTSRGRSPRPSSSRTLRPRRLRRARCPCFRCRPRGSVTDSSPARWPAGRSSTRLPGASPRIGPRAARTPPTAWGAAPLRPTGTTSSRA